MGIDGEHVLDINGPANEIDEIERILPNHSGLLYLIYLYKNNLFEKKSKEVNCMLQMDDGKLFTLYKNGDIKGNITFESLLKFPDQLAFPSHGPDDLRRWNKNYLQVSCRFTCRGNYPTAEFIEELSKHFPNTVFRNHYEDENGCNDLVICRYVNGKHVVWSTGWGSLENWHEWDSSAIRERNARRETTTTTCECGCTSLLMPCQYKSPVYDCYVEVYGKDKDVAELFEKRRIQVKKHREKLFMHFQYTKNPIKLMEWLSEKFAGCYFVCEYSNDAATQCRWENYKAFHYPYELKKL